MGFFYKKTDKELLDIRNNIFLKEGISFLEKNGFKKSPYSTAWYGKNNLGDYTYELCRLSDNSDLTILTTHISSGDRWIKIMLNIFKLEPTPHSLTDLQGKDGLKFLLPPNSLTEMRLRVDDFDGLPLLNFTEHKLKSFQTKRGLERRKLELSELIKRDMSNIDKFIDNWYNKYNPSQTDWEGNAIEK